jgi:hypothetical protein
MSDRFGREESGGQGYDRGEFRMKGGILLEDKFVRAWVWMLIDIAWTVVKGVTVYRMS